MRYPVVGSEALGSGRLTRGQLRWNFHAVQPGVYIPNGVEAGVVVNAQAAWLWTGRRGIIAGRAASALHGAKWVDGRTPIEIITEHTRPRSGIIVREERISDDEVMAIGQLAVTTPLRTALDLARHLRRDVAVAHLDALARAAGVTARDVLELSAKYPGARGIRQARESLILMDPGAQSPRETRLRLMLIDDGLPAPQTQIRVSDGFAKSIHRHGL